MESWNKKSITQIKINWINIKFKWYWIMGIIEKSEKNLTKDFRLKT